MTCHTAASNQRPTYAAVLRCVCVDILCVLSQNSLCLLPFLINSPTDPPPTHTPSLLPHSSSPQLLTTLELPFKTIKGVTVDEVASRLVPCGFYKDPTKLVMEYGPHLLLDNITKYVRGWDGGLGGSLACGWWLTLSLTFVQGERATWAFFYRDSTSPMWSTALTCCWTTSLSTYGVGMGGWGGSLACGWWLTLSLTFVQGERATWAFFYRDSTSPMWSTALTCCWTTSPSMYGVAGEGGVIFCPSPCSVGREGFFV
jgi:hypothetical protein